MKIKKEDNKIIITPKKGMWLTNGDTFGKEVTLPDGASQSDWQEITEEEYNERTKVIEEE